MAYDIVSMYLNIRNKSDFAATKHLCLERIHWPSKALQCECICVIMQVSLSILDGGGCMCARMRACGKIIGKASSKDAQG